MAAGVLANLKVLRFAVITWAGSTRGGVQMTSLDNARMGSATIVLTTLNAKYIHASLGLRYLLANMARYAGQELRDQSLIREFTISRDPKEIVEELLALNPAIIGLGVYIWNVRQTTEVLRQLKAARPEVKLVLGGPEVSHETDDQEVVALADHVITGWGDVSFPKLCRRLLELPAIDKFDQLRPGPGLANSFYLSSDVNPPPKELPKIIAGEQPPLKDIAMPYSEYGEEDLAHRQLYVEASRGCPFKCEFCLSSLDKTAWAFDLDRFLAELDKLHLRGARNFKFVDRTFNLKVENSVRILQFFLDRLSQDLFVHFEVVPDHLPERLKELIARFPPGALQFEVGIQSFNEDVQKRISRKQDNAKSDANLRWLVQESGVHLHVDLIFGLPGETLESFAAGFDRLYALGPHEIQLGVLKRLRGTPIGRHSQEHGMIFDEDPPYAVQQTGVIDRQAMQDFARLARYWDLLANSGRFSQTLDLLLQGPSAFLAFQSFSEWLWKRHSKTAGLNPEMLVDDLFVYLTGKRQLDTERVRAHLLKDYLTSGARARPNCLRQLLAEQAKPKALTARQGAQRQRRHLMAVQG